MSEEATKKESSEQQAVAKEVTKGDEVAGKSQAESKGKKSDDTQAVQSGESEGASEASVKSDVGSSAKKGEASKGDEKSETAPVKPKIKRRKNVRRQVQRGKAFINSTYNNTKVSFSDLHGNVLAWSAAGLLGFKGAKKATTYAANQVLNSAHEKVQRYGLKDVEVFVKGVGSGRDAALRALVQKGYNIISIKDTTPIPHNGCRPKKARRV